jgi:hypothetical protein
MLVDTSVELRSIDFYVEIKTRLLPSSVIKVLYKVYTNIFENYCPL